MNHVCRDGHQGNDESGPTVPFTVGPEVESRLSRLGQCWKVVLTNAAMAAAVFHQQARRVAERASDKRAVMCEVAHG